MNYFKLLWDLYVLKRNEHKTTAQMHRIQEKYLRKMLAYAYQNSPYYHQAFENAGISAEAIGIAPLSSFPTLDKATLLSRFEEIVTVPGLTQEKLRQFDAGEKASRKPFQGKYHIVHSSGSTGKPGYFVYDTSAWNQMLLGIIRGALWDMSMPEIIKLLARGPHIAYIAATDGRYGGAMAVGDGIDGLHASQIHLDIKMPLAGWIEKLREFRPNIVIGYPSAVKILAELAERGDVDLELIRVITCGEPLGISQRHYLEKIFCTQVVNFYGASESLALGVETDPDEGMILFDDRNVIEVQDGEMYLTSLYNFAQPLIRYRISDNLTLQKPTGNSRFPFTRATGLFGRDEDLMWFEDRYNRREFLHPLAIEGFCVEGLKDYQFRQTGKDSFEMLAEISGAASMAEIEMELYHQIQGILAGKNLDYVRFAIYFTDKIRPDPRTGKKRLIIKADEIGRLVG